MADFQEMLDFPPAPKLDVFGKLDPAKATQSRTPRPRDLLWQGSMRKLSPAALPPGGALAPRSRRLAGYSGSGRTSRCPRLGRGCIGRLREGEISETIRRT